MLNVIFLIPFAMSVDSEEEYRFQIHFPDCASDK